MKSLSQACVLPFLTNRPAPLGPGYPDEIKGLGYPDEIKTQTKDLEAAPEKSVILFHACAHNPTGADPSVDDWKRLAEVCKQKSHFPIFDTAYQGFASGDPNKDAWSLRYFADQGFEMMVCQSFSKNFGLYNERAGNLVLVVKDAQTLKQCKSQTELIIR